MVEHKTGLRIQAVVSELKYKLTTIGRRKVVASELKYAYIVFEVLTNSELYKFSVRTNYILTA
jgi:hypothetical protein